MDAEPKRISDLLGVILAKYGYADSTSRGELEDIWNAAAPERARDHTRVGSLRRGELEILVDSPALLAQLESFEKARLLKAFQTQLKHSQVSRLRFRRL
jgi:predicted amino acid dehydrogenase